MKVKSAMDNSETLTTVGHNTNKEGEIHNGQFRDIDNSGPQY